VLEVWGKLEADCPGFDSGEGWDMWQYERFEQEELDLAAYDSAQVAAYLVKAVV